MALLDGIVCASQEIDGLVCVRPFKESRQIAQVSQNPMESGSSLRVVVHEGVSENIVGTLERRVSLVVFGNSLPQEPTVRSLTLRLVSCQKRRMSECSLGTRQASQRKDGPLLSRSSRRPLAAQ